MQSMVFPGSEYTYCIKHMYENFKKYKGKLLMDLFKRVVSATHLTDYRRAMEMLQQADPLVEGRESALDWLEKVAKKKKQW